MLVCDFELYIMYAILVIMWAAAIGLISLTFAGIVEWISCKYRAYANRRDYMQTRMRGNIND